MRSDARADDGARLARVVGWVGGGRDGAGVAATNRMPCGGKALQIAAQSFATFGQSSAPFFIGLRGRPLQQCSDKNAGRMSCHSYDPLTKPTAKELIVAKPDHTAPARPSGSPDDKPTNPLSRPFYLDTADDPGLHVLAKLGSIAMAINVITCLLANSDAFRDAQAHNEPTEPGHWPLAPACAEGLFAAIYFLNQYAETLSHESLVSPGV